jgi:superfamily I DNA/RNA helicase
MAKVRVTFLDEEVAILARNFDIMPRSQAVIDFEEWGKQKETLEGIIQKWGYEDTIKPEDLHREYVDVILQYDCQTKEDYLEASRRGRGFRLGKKQRKAIWDMCEVYQEKQFKSGYKHASYIFNEVARYLRAHPEKMPYKHVVADELQDFDLPRLRVLRALAPEGENDLFLVGDPFQKIYNVETNFKKAGIHVKGRRGKRLRINYRTTEEIRKYAIQPLEKLEKMNIYFRNFNGKVDTDQDFLSIREGVVPTYEIFKTREEELSNLLESLQTFTDPEGEYKFRPEEIVVAAFRRTEGREIYNYLYSQEFPCYLYQSGANRGDVNGVRISTLHSLKGLEYKVVILTGISEQNYQNWKVDDIFKEGAQPMIRSKGALLYVACTRAILYLELSGVGKKVAFLQNQ